MPAVGRLWPSDDDDDDNSVSFEVQIPAYHKLPKKNTFKFMVFCVLFRRISFRYMMRDLTVLKLREKFFSFSGDDCTIKDMDGKDWFKYVHNLEKRICKYLSSIKNSRFEKDEEQLKYQI